MANKVNVSKVFKFIICLLILNYLASSMLYSNLLDIYQDYSANIYVKPKSNDAPVIVINFPLNYTLFGEDAPDYSLSISGNLLNYTWYEFMQTNEKSVPFALDGVSSIDITETFENDLWKNLNNGTTIVRFYANNSLDELGYKDIIIRIDIKEPEIEIVSPTGGFFNSTPPGFILDITEANLNKTWYMLNSNTTKHFFEGISGVINGSAWNYEVDGNVDITFYANDSMSNEDLKSVQVSKDTVNATGSIIINDNDAWTNSTDVLLSLTYADSNSGVSEVRYSNNGTTWTGWESASSTKDWTLSGGDGFKTVYYQIKDNAGNIYQVTDTIGLDTLSPSSPITLFTTPSSWTNNNKFNLTWTNPTETSGIIGAYYKLDTPPIEDDDGTYIEESDIDSITDITVGSEGNHSIYVWLVDVAGNFDYTTYAISYLCFDNSNPNSPIALIASPSSWTNINSFDISWSNPIETSGIVGAYYKVGTVPTANDDGTYIEGADIESISGISVGSEGNHTIYVWLVDMVGNVDYTTYAIVYLCLDISDPSSPLTLTSSPSGWTNVDDFDITWNNPIDTSGIIGAYYKVGTVPTANDDGTYIEGTDLESIIGITVGSEGNHTIYVWLVDAASNVDYTTYAITYLCLDISDPSSPLTLISNPSSWTNIDSFDLSWSNPVDTSGIVGAYYKIGTAPTANDDGTYIVGADLESIIGITVGSEGNHTIYVWLVDAAGNLDYITYTVAYLCLDISDPSSPLTLISSPSGWTNIDSFDISWSNPIDTSGIIGVYYKVGTIPTANDDGTYVEGADIESIIGIIVGSEGNHTIYVWLVDAAGNVDYTTYAVAYLCLDISDPSSPLTLISSPSGWTNIDSFDITWANPADTSGIVGAYYKIGTIPTANDDGTYIAGADIESIIGITVGSEGNHTIYVWLADTAGNVDYLSNAIAYLCFDDSIPSYPIALTATPSSWTNINSFDVSWSNPADTSGILGAYYKIGSAPTANDDGTYVAEADIESIASITVGSEGNHTIHVWLVDAAGNVDYTTYAITYLCLDISDPSSPLTLISSPSGWTNLDDFDITWNNPIDTSGIIGAYYKVGSIPTANDDGTYIAGADIESITSITMGSEGNHTIYVWLVDAAGNVDYTTYAITYLCLDISDPSSPLTLISSPSGWTNIDSFDISWLNPADTSGIVGAYYKIGIAPTANDDGTYIGGADIESISGITMGSEGNHTIYVWLVDAAGNVDYTSNVITYLCLDIADPSSPLTLVSNPSGWTNLDDFDISWSNPVDTSGVVGAYYKVGTIPTANENGTYIAGADIESITSITVGSEGNHTIYVWLVDAAGNVDYTTYAITYLCLDISDPSSPLSLISSPSGWTNIDDFDISWANPVDTSGIVGAYYKVGTAPIANDDGTYVEGVDLESITGITVGSEGNHTIYVWLVDAASNLDYDTYAVSYLCLDISDPSSPLTLTVDPSSWTNIDSFDISWSNPVDTSGVVGAYYKIGTVPTANDDGTYVEGVDLESITGIAAGSEGNHTIYVWLVDAASNLDYNTYAVSYLCLDISDPSSPLTLTVDPSSWTNIDSFDISWSNPVDTSGIVGAYYKIGTVPTANDDGTYVEGTDIESITGITVGSEGNHTIYVWLVDAAGNLDYTSNAVTYLCLDSSDPSSPLTLTIDPPSWTNIDDFDITWTNPVDTSGIIGAYYKIGTDPTANDDGTYIAGADIESITGIIVESEGNHTIYVWLVDAAGNVDYTTYAINYLCLDISDPSSPLTLTVDPSSWTNIDSFDISWSNPVDTSGISGVYYKLNNIPISNDDGTYVEGADIESITGITVGSEGNHTIYVWLVDAAGNVDYTTYAIKYLCLDLSNPTSPVILTSSPSSWINIDSFDISWSNPADTSGIVGAYYKVGIIPTANDDGTYLEGVDIESITGITVGTEGNHTIYVWLVDAAGNVDYTTYAISYLCLDISDPTSPVTLTVDPSSWTNIDNFDISWANPVDTSGIIGAYYKVGSVPTANDDGTYLEGVDIESIVGITAGTEENHTIYVWLVDAAGNVDYATYAINYLCLDISNPTSPLTLTVNPSSWTNIDSFDISWANPVDTSGIVGAYYKVGIIPTANDDGTYLEGIDIESITSITVGSEGNHTIYVWLVDVAGNVDYATYAINYLCLDISDPSSPLTLTPSPSSWTNNDNFDLSWSNPVDTSGISGVYYKLNNIPISNDDGVYIEGSDIEMITDISVVTEGNHTIYVWLVDAAGNVDYTTYAITYLCLDISNPSIIDFQGGDNIWRNTTGTTYNVDFSDNLPSSYINYAQYKITTEIEQGGIILKDWTNIFINLDSNIYTINWTIDFSFCQEGFNYISVRVYDNAGNTALLDDVFYVKKDTINPTITDLQNGDDIWRNTAGTTYNVDFSDTLPSSNLNYALYKITTEPGQTGIVLKDWTFIFTNLGASSYTTNWPIDFAVCRDGLNYISVRVYDEAGNVQMINDAFYIKKDTTAPILIINAPTNNTYYDSPPPINVTFIDLTTSVLTYNVKGDLVWLANNSEVPLEEYIWEGLSQGAFQIEFTCYDYFGQYTELTITLYKDTDAPILIINSPLNNTYWNSRPFLNVSAFDPNLESIWYRFNNLNFTMTNNTLQQLNSSIWNTLPEEGEFQIKFYANDSFGKINDEFMLILYKDILSPRLTLINPLNNTYWNIRPSLQVVVNDTYFESMWYRVEGYERPLSNNSLLELDLAIWNSLPDEYEFVIFFYANDTTGNLNEIYQLILYKDIIGPRITIISPNYNDLFGEIPPDYEISINEPNLNQTWYTLIGGSYNFSFTEWLGTLDQTVWDELEDDTIIIRFYANDTLNNLGYSDVTIRKSLGVPIITINNPKENYLYGIDAPAFEIYKSGEYLVSTWYTLDNGNTNFTFTGTTGVIDQTAWEDFNFGNVTIQFYVNDSLGRIGFDSITLRKDPDTPIVSVSYIYPIANSSYCKDAPIFMVSVYEPNIDSIWYEVEGMIVPLTNNSETELLSTIWENLPQGTFTIKIFANDTLGYINDPLTIIFKKDTLAPTISINQPLEYYYDSPPPINITVYDPNFNYLIYTCSGYSFPLENNTGSFLDEELIWDNLDQGEFSIRITAVDIFNHINNSVVITLYKDTMGPIFLSASPEDMTYYNSPPALKISYFDPNLHTIRYKIGSDYGFISNNSEELLDLAIWANIDEGEFTIEFYANDSFGYFNDLVSITLIKDTVIPLIFVNSPQNNTYYSNLYYPNITIQASDLNIDEVWYSILGVQFYLAGGTEPLDPSIWDSLDQGPFQIYLFANDTAGNLNSSLMLTLYKDTLAPLVIVNSPANNTFWHAPQTLNFAAWDINLESIQFRVLNYTRSLFNNTDEPFPLDIWLNLPQGPFIVEIIAIDSLGNINNSITLTLVKDTIPPSILINSPQPYALFGEIAPNFDISVTENNLNATWYILVGTGEPILFTNASNSINQTLWDYFENGTVTIRFYANDTAGNEVFKDLILRKNIYAPIITIISPENNDLFGSDTPSFIIYTSGVELNTTWYTLDNGLTNYTFTGLNPIINSEAWGNYVYGVINLRFYINDSFGKVGFDEIYLRKDAVMPEIIVNSPLNQTAISSAPFLNLTINEPNLPRVWYSLGGAIIDISNNLTQYLNKTLWEALPQGTLVIKLYANDTLGNLNNLYQLILSKDTIGPNITIVLPNDNQKAGRDAPFFELSLSDVNGIDHCWYIIDGNYSIMRFTGTIGRIEQAAWERIWDNLTNGERITIRFYANDTLGNIQYKELSLIKQVPIDLPRFFSDPIGFLFPIIGAVVMLPITVKLTKSRYYKTLNSKEKKKLKNVLIATFFFLSLIIIFYLI